MKEFFRSGKHPACAEGVARSFISMTLGRLGWRLELTLGARIDGSARRTLGAVGMMNTVSKWRARNIDVRHQEGLG